MQGLIGGPVTVMFVGFLSAYTVRLLVDYKVYLCPNPLLIALLVEGRERMRETTGYEPFALHAPMRWAI